MTAADTRVVMALVVLVVVARGADRGGDGGGHGADPLVNGTLRATNDVTSGVSWRQMAGCDQAFRGGNRGFVGRAYRIRTQYRPPNPLLTGGLFLLSAPEDRIGEPSRTLLTPRWNRTVGNRARRIPFERAMSKHSCRGYQYDMDFLLWILAVVLVVAGIFAIVRSQVLWGVVLIVVGLIVGPGGVSLLS